MAADQQGDSVDSLTRCSVHKHFQSRKPVHYSNVSDKVSVNEAMKWIENIYIQKKGESFEKGPLFLCAPGMAPLLGGASPLHTRQGEVLAERQGCPPRGGI